jgi:hypothetical protein
VTSARTSDRDPAADHRQHAEAWNPWFPHGPPSARCTDQTSLASRRASPVWQNAESLTA